MLLVGCGTSYQLAQAAACNFESVCDVPAFAYSAGEFCAGGVVCDRGALVVGISASGQTAEVAEALQKAAAFGARTASLTGDPDSPLARAGGTLLSLPCSLPGGLPPVTHFVLGYVLLALVAVDWGLRQKTITPLFGRMAVKLCATHGREPGRAAVRRTAGIFVSGQPAFTGACVPVCYPVYAAFAAVYRPRAGRATGGAAAGAAPVFCRIGHV